MAGALTTTEKQRAIQLHAHGFSLVEMARQISRTLQGVCPDFS